jgi:hypothetical protein
MLLALNKQYRNLLLITTIMWAQESSNSELQLESYVSFTAKAKLGKRFNLRIIFLMENPWAESTAQWTRSMGAFHGEAVHRVTLGHQSMDLCLWFYESKGYTMI